MRHRRRNAEQILYIVDCAVKLHDVRFPSTRLRVSRKRQSQGKYKHTVTHESPPELRNEVQHSPEAESMRDTARQRRRHASAILSWKMKRQPNSLRIVSLAPSATSILCALGAKKSLVGVTKWCADVAPVEGLPKLGDCWHMESVEEILRLKPTLVIGSVPYKQETVVKLLEQPLNFLAMNPRSLADIANDIRLLGGIVGRIKAAEMLTSRMRRAFSQIEKKTKHSK